MNLLLYIEPVLDLRKRLSQTIISDLLVFVNYFQYVNDINQMFNDK